MSSPLTPAQRLAALQKIVAGSSGGAVGSDFPNLNPTPTSVPTTTLADDKTTAAPLSATQATTASQSITQAAVPNLLRKYASYNPVISLMATNTANYNRMVQAQKFYPEDWDVICKTGGVGPQKARGFLGGTTDYFSRDLEIDTVNITTIVGMSQHNRGSNAVDVDFTIVEPFGMDLIEQLYDYSNNALGESNYCQVPYMLRIEFKGVIEDGTIETVPFATKYIPIHLLNMEVKVNNMGAIYKVHAVAFNELGLTEQLGRIPSTIQLGTELALAREAGVDKQTEQDLANGTNNLGVSTTIAHQAGTIIASGSANIAPIGTGGVLHEITESFTGVLNQIQKKLAENGSIAVPDQYVITYVDLPDKNSADNSINIGQYLFLDTATLTDVNIPTVAKDYPMAKPAANQQKPFDATIAGQNILRYTVNSTTGETQSGAVSYINPHLITFNAGSSIVDCLNTLIINSSYIVSQINWYNALVRKINTEAAAANLQDGSPIPPDLQEKVNQLNNTPLNWFKIVPSTTLNAYDGVRGVKSHTITYNVIPYKVYNARSISAPNGNPIADNRIVKEYDYIFTGNNTEVLSFDLNFNNAFLTYTQFNHDTKIQGTGGGMPAFDQQVTASSVLQTVSSPITNGQLKYPVSSSNKNPMGVGAITPERNQAADVASTIYAVGEQIQLDLNIYGDPDFIQQDGLFINPITNSAFLYPSANTSVRGILFNNGEVYANVNFKIPQDINLNTGLLDLAFQGDATNYKRNVFSGQYRVITVTNKFEKGLFTQNLNLVRLDDSHNFGINAEQAKIIANTQTTQEIVEQTQQGLGIQKPDLQPLSLAGAFPQTTSIVNSVIAGLHGLPL